MGGVFSLAKAVRLPRESQIEYTPWGNQHCAKVRVPTNEAQPGQTQKKKEKTEVKLKTLGKKNCMRIVPGKKARSTWERKKQEF